MSTPIISHSDCGTVTTLGENSFSAFCSAYGMMYDKLMVLSIAGSSTSVDAIRATVSLQKPIRHNVSNYESYTHSTKGERYLAYRSALPTFNGSNLILVNTRFTDPTIDPDYAYGLGITQHGSATNIVRDILRKHIPIAILPEWVEALLKQFNYRSKPFENLNIKYLQGRGVVGVQIPKSIDLWEELITTCLKEGKISFNGVKHG